MKSADAEEDDKVPFDDEDSEEEADDGTGDEVEDSDDESDDESDDDNESDEQPVEVGMRVIASTKKGDAAGEIIEVFEDEGKVRVRLDEGRTVKISVEKLEAEPIQQPPKKARRSSKKRS